MADPTLKYRIWQRDVEWHWQVVSSDKKEVLLSGVAATSVAARSAAFQYCLQHPGYHAEPK